LADLASDMRLKDIAAKWGLNYNTASYHRTQEQHK
jgi:DNA-binding CsgD family transcriptional regulator